MSIEPILIADPMPLYRTGIIQALKNHSFQFKETDSIYRLRQALLSHQFQVVIVDYSIIEKDPNAFSDAFKQQFACGLIVLLSEVGQYENLSRIPMNIEGYLSKNCPDEEISIAIQKVLIKERYYSQSILNFLIDSKLKKSNQTSQNLLTKREIEIAQHIAVGKKNKEIAAILHLSPHTIHTHRKNIMKKTGVGSALELSHYVLKTGLM